MHLAFLISMAYLIGSVPTALWVSRIFFGIDIREHGSGNMGATNTFRVLGTWYGIFVLVVDMGKGIAAVQLYRCLHTDDWWSHEIMFWQLVFGLVAIAGHIFPVFAGFRGGKGVATLFGVVLAIQPWTALISVLAFLIVVLLTRYISAGSLAGVIVFAACVFFVFRETDLYIRWFAGLSALLVIFLHRKNLMRLWKGTENKISFKKKDRSKH